MARTRLEVAVVAASQYMEVEFPTRTPRVNLRSQCFSILKWVLSGGDKPRGGAIPNFYTRLIVRSVNKGLEHAYGDSHKQEIDPQIYVRRDSL